MLPRHRWGHQVGWSCWCDWRGRHRCARTTAPCLPLRLTCQGWGLGLEFGFKTFIGNPVSTHCISRLARHNGSDAALPHVLIVLVTHNKLNCNAQGQTYDNLVGLLWNVGLLDINQPLLAAAGAPPHLARPIPARWVRQEELWRLRVSVVILLRAWCVLTGRVKQGKQLATLGTSCVCCWQCCAPDTRCLLLRRLLCWCRWTTAAAAAAGRPASAAAGGLAASAGVRSAAGAAAAGAGTAAGGCVRQTTLRFVG